MMDQVGAEHGCGQAMWEYESNLSRFGTPMALMLMPYFTDGCIGSMEGLYFEASSTTPFHFINQSELSPAPSRAQRDLPYPNFDMAAGIRHLQLMGVPYFMASSQQTVDAARANPDLTELASTEVFPQADGTTRQWVVFEVADAEPVVSLENLPVVVTPEDDHIDGWVYDEERPEPTTETPNPQKTPGPAMDWYLDPSRWDTPLATSGPDNWPRVARRCGRGALGAGDAGGGHQRRAGERVDQLRRERHRLAGAGEDELLPQLEGLGGRRPLPGDPQLHGGGAHRAPRHPQLRPHRRRLARLPDGDPRDRRDGGAGPGRPAAPRRRAPADGGHRHWSRAGPRAGPGAGGGCTARLGTARGGLPEAGLPALPDAGLPDTGPSDDGGGTTER